MELVSEIRKAYTEVTQRRLDVEFSDDITIRTPEGIHARALVRAVRVHVCEFVRRVLFRSVCECFVSGLILHFLCS
jgi:hypothetical protein